MMKRVLSLVMIFAILLTILPKQMFLFSSATEEESIFLSSSSTSSESDALAELPFTGDKSNFALSSMQAQAYASVINQAIQNFENMDDYGSVKEVHVTMFTVGKSVMLWIAYIDVYDYTIPDFSGDFEYKDGVLNVRHEEIWQWDGSNAIQVNTFSDYRTHINYWDDGLEYYTHYTGTDADGRAWNAFYPFEGNAISTVPKWCYARTFVYGHSPSDIDSGKITAAQIAEKTISEYVDSGYWPELPLDWNTAFSSVDFGAQQDFVFLEIGGGMGFAEMRQARQDEYGYYYPQQVDCGQQCAGFIGKEDGTWKEATAVAAALDTYANTAPEVVINGIVVYSDHNNPSIQKDHILTLYAGLNIDGTLCEDASRLSFQIEDSTILKLVSNSNVPGYLCLKLKGLTKGSTFVTFNDSSTGQTVRISVYVNDNTNRSYTLNNVPTRDLDGFQNNFYDFNGLYIDNYQYTINDNFSVNVSFDVYNSSFVNGVIEVYDQNGNLKTAKLLDRRQSNNSSIKEVLFDKFGYLITDAINKETSTYRSQATFSKHTPVELTIPENGYLRITVDPCCSMLVYIINSLDLLLAITDLVDSFTSLPADSDEILSKVTSKLIENEIVSNLLKDSPNMAKKYWEDISLDLIKGPESIGRCAESISRNFEEMGLKKLIFDPAADYSFSVLENVFITLTGPIGAIASWAFVFAKSVETATQMCDLSNSAFSGALYIQNQDGNFRSCHQVRVENPDQFPESTALHVYSTTLDSQTLESLRQKQPELHKALTESISHTYNITLMENGSETQPNGEVTVYIPVSEDLKPFANKGNAKVYRIETDGSMTDMNASVKDGYFVFSTTHFSLYTTLGLNTPIEAPTNAPTLKTVIMIIAGVTIIAVLAASIILISVKRNKNKKVSKASYVSAKNSDIPSNDEPRFCGECGAPFSEDGSFCEVCGNQIRPVQE